MADFGLGIWLHSVTGFEDADEVQRHADRLAAGGVDIFIPCVKNPPGVVDFLTEAGDVNPAYPDWDPLGVLIAACRERGVKVHPWFCVFPEGDKSGLIREHPEYAAEFEANFPWACAMRQEVQDYVFGLYRSLAERYRPAGLHLDYIRQGGHCTCAHCRSQMHREGIDITTVEYADPAWQRWCEWRVERITGLVRRMRAFTAEEGLELSAAVFANYPDCREQQAQDWVQWIEEGLLDYVFPMNYTGSARMAAMRTLTHAALVGGRAPLWEGLSKQSGASRLGPEALTEQTRQCLAAGAEGIVVFSYPALTDEDFAAVQALRKS